MVARQARGSQAGQVLDECSNQSLIASQSDTARSANSDQQSDADEEDEGGLPNYSTVEYQGRTETPVCRYLRQEIDVDADYQLSTEPHAMEGLPEEGFHRPGIFVSGNPNGGLPVCNAVRIPASHFEDGVLPRPFEIKLGKGIFPSNRYDPKNADRADIYPEGAVGPQTLFDAEGYAIAIIDPTRSTEWMKDVYPDIDLSTIAPPSCDPHQL